MKDLTYCTAADCPSTECRIKLANNDIQPGTILSMTDFSCECRFYIGWMYSRLEEDEDGHFYFREEGE